MNIVRWFIASIHCNLYILTCMLKGRILRYQVDTIAIYRVFVFGYGEYKMTLAVPKVFNKIEVSAVDDTGKTVRQFYLYVNNKITSGE